MRSQNCCAKKLMFPNFRGAMCFAVDVQLASLMVIKFMFFVPWNLNIQLFSNRCVADSGSISFPILLMGRNALQQANVTVASCIVPHYLENFLNTCVDLIWCKLWNTLGISK